MVAVISSASTSRLPLIDSPGTVWSVPCSVLLTVSVNSPLFKPSASTNITVTMVVTPVRSVGMAGSRAVSRSTLWLTQVPSSFLA